MVHQTSIFRIFNFSWEIQYNLGISNTTKWYWVPNWCNHLMPEDPIEFENHYQYRESAYAICCIIEWTEFQDFQIWKKNWPGVSHNGPVSPTIPLILKAYWRNMQFHGLFIIIEYICTLNEGQVFGRWVIWESLKLKLKCIDTSNSGLEKISFKIDQSAACTIAHHSLHTGFSMFFCKISTIL